MLYAKRMPFKQQSYFMISLESNKQRDSDNCLGKLRALDNEHNKFVLYDNGENFNQKGVQFKYIRKEIAAINYWYEPCNIGNIRKMLVIMPTISCVNIKSFRSNNLNTDENQESSRSQPHHKKVFNPLESSKDNIQLLPSQRSYRPNDISLRSIESRDEDVDPMNLVYTFIDWRPTNETETLLAVQDK